MPDAEPPEIYCPNCRNYVVPLKAAVSWYCPRCAWQFSDEEVQRRRRPESSQSSALCASQRPWLAEK